MGLVDRIFTRIGAQDEIHAGLSTFMVEMVETANILNNATNKSLLILDEMVDKAKTSDSGQEMMYELLDMIADGELKTRLWMIGNFRQGSLDEVFGDRDPVYRRIEENFICVGVTGKEMEEFHIFREER